MCPSPNPRKEDINKRKIKQRATFFFFLPGPIEERTNSKRVPFSKYLIFYTIPYRDPSLSHLFVFKKKEQKESFHPGSYRPLFLFVTNGSGRRWYLIRWLYKEDGRLSKRKNEKFNGILEESLFLFGIEKRSSYVILDYSYSILDDESIW